MTSNSPQTVHLLSKRSVALKRDTFIFNPHTGKIRLFIGINQKLTQASPASLRRWIRLIGSPIQNYELRPVELRKWPRMVLGYSVPMELKGPVISPLDSTTLPAGNYGWYGTTPATTQPVAFRTKPGILTLLEEDKRGHLYYNEEVINKNALTKSIKLSVMARDKECFFTAGLPQKGALDVSWILHPMWSFKSIDTLMPDDYDSMPYITESNAITMQEGLIPLFLDNAFGVDVDDKYRIVVFKDLGDFKLHSHLPNHSESTSSGPNDRFLREHFRWCLTVNLLGGDISEDFSAHDLEDAYDEFGVREDEELLAANDDRWKSPLGKEILDMCHRMKDDRLTPLHDLLK